MKLLFECDTCRQQFAAEGQLEEWTSTLYGPCREYKAPCPSCGSPSKEHRVKSSKSEGSGFDAGGDSGGASCGEGSCGTDSCPMMN
jgi:hypothetical protein